MTVPLWHAPLAKHYQTERQTVRGLERQLWTSQLPRLESVSQFPCGCRFMSYAKDTPRQNV